MALVLDSTVGGANANTYLSLSEALAYFEKRLNASTFTNAATSEQEKALANATHRLDQEPFDGIRANSSVQALKWPRSGALDSDDVEVSSSIIPQRIKDATCELALHMLKSDTQSEDELKKFEELKVGAISLKPRAGAKNVLPEEVRRLIAVYQRDFDRARLIRG